MRNERIEKREKLIFFSRLRSECAERDDDDDDDDDNNDDDDDVFLSSNVF